MIAERGEAPGGLGRLATLLCALGLVVAFVPAAPAAAVPPPPPRPDLRIDLVRDGPEQVVRDTVRAYQPVAVAVEAQAGERLLLRLSDRDRLLVLQIDAPSGLPWITGAQPGPDGIELRFAEAGVHRLQVLMSGDAARAGRAASFELGLRLRR